MRDVTNVNGEKKLGILADITAIAVSVSAILDMICLNRKYKATTSKVEKAKYCMDSIFTGISVGTMFSETTSCKYSKIGSLLNRLYTRTSKSSNKNKEV